jgi:Mce-associated membrane protein
MPRTQELRSLWPMYNAPRYFHTSIRAAARSGRRRIFAHLLCDNRSLQPDQRIAGADCHIDVRSASIPIRDDQADAEAAAKLASARAEQARRRATELRKRAQVVTQAASGPAAPTTPDDGDVADEGPAEDDDKAKPTLSRARSRRRWRPRRLRPRTLVVVVAVLLVCASFGASGAMWWRHDRLLAEQQRTADFTAAARAEVTDLMSIDFTRARDGVQRVIDHSTGQFRDQFRAGADDLIAGLEQAKVTTSVTVKAVAVKAMTDDSADVLVAATSKASSLQGAQRNPRDFRISLTLQRDNGQLKMSRVEFVK